LFKQQDGFEDKVILGAKVTLLPNIISDALSQTLESIMGIALCP